MVLHVKLSSAQFTLEEENTFRKIIVCTQILNGTVIQFFSKLQMKELNFFSSQLEEIEPDDGYFQNDTFTSNTSRNSEFLPVDVFTMFP